MFSRTGGLFIVLIVGNVLAAQEPAEDRVAERKPNDLFGIGNMAQAAADLRQAGEAFERFADAAGGIGETIAASMATMSSEFDPFGYKTAFRTIGQQTQIIQQQSQMIRELQQREIERLRDENRLLTKQLEKLRRRKPR